MADWIFLDNHRRVSPSKEIVKQREEDCLHYWLLGDARIAPVKQEICRLVGALDGHSFFASNREEAYFQVFFSHYMEFIRETGRTHILSLETESPSLLEEIKSLEKLDVQGKWLPVNSQGQLTGKALQELIRPRSGMLSLSWAHALTGVIQPISDLVEICLQQEIRVHLDISTAMGKIYFQFLDLPIDFLTLDGKLLRAGSDMAALFVKNKAALPKREDPSYASMASFALSLKKAEENIDHYAIEVARLRDYFEMEMQALGATLFFQEVDRLPNCAVIAFRGIHAEHLLFHLQRQGVWATTGKGELSGVLKSCQIDPVLAHSAISFVLSEETKEEEIVQLIEIISSLVKKLTPLGAFC